jgi:excisionase family DNA binding protein
MATETKAQSMVQENEEFMTPDEVCKVFKMSLRTLQNMVDSGAIVRIHIFGKINRFRREDIDRIKQGLLPYNLDKSGFMMPHTNNLANKLRKQREAAKARKEKENVA